MINKNLIFYGKCENSQKQKKWIFQSAVSGQLTEIHNLTHQKNKKKIKRAWLNHLTPLSLAIWWYDDGSLICHTWCFMYRWL